MNCHTYISAVLVEQSFPCTSSEAWVNFNPGFWDISLLWDQKENFSEFLRGCLGYQKFCFHDCILGGSLISWVDGKSEILDPLLCYLGDHKFWLLSFVDWEGAGLCCLGDQKFWLSSCVVWGVRNFDSSPVLFGGSEILTPLLCCLGGQKFWILSCVVWGIRHSQSSPVSFGGSEILNPLLCCLEDEKFWLRSFFVWEIRNSESSPVFFGEPNKVDIKNRKLLGKIFTILANRETFPVSFNTRLRLKGSCKNRLWN